MKTFLFCTALYCSFWANSHAQEKETLPKMDREKFFKSTQASTCNCIDTLEVRGKSSEEIASSISNCIKISVHTIQLMDALFKSEALAENEKKKKDSSKVQININIDENSEDYKIAYFELERALNDSCKALKAKMNVNDKANKNSLTENDEAYSFFLKGLEAGDKGDHKLAVEHYKKAVEIDTNFAFAWDNLGLSYRNLEQFDLALFAYKKSLQADPKGITPLQNMAIVYQYKEEYNKALDCYKRISILEPNNPESFYGAGLVYCSFLKDYKNGLENLCKAYNLYIKLKSPYRSDAEKLISMIYAEMKERGRENEFQEILKQNNIKTK